MPVSGECRVRRNIKALTVVTLFNLQFAELMQNTTNIKLELVNLLIVLVQEALLSQRGRATSVYL